MMKIEKSGAFLMSVFGRTAAGPTGTMRCSRFSRRESQVITFLLMGAAVLLLQASLHADEAFYWEGNGHWYEPVYIPSHAYWYPSRDDAATRGGYLATVHSAEENAFITNLISDDKYWTAPEVGGGGPFLGGYLSAGWRWVTDEPWNYTNWLPGAPSGGDENVLNIHRREGGGWNDLNSTRDWAFGYIVEYNSNPMPPPEPDVYGIFIGVRQTAINKLGLTVDVPFNAGAENLYETMSKSFGIKDDHAAVLASDGINGSSEVTENRIKEALSQWKLKQGDKLIFYASGHGISTTVSDNPSVLGKIYLGDENWLWSDHLAEWLGEENAGVEKWVMLDSCESASFWNVLKEVQNIALFASAPEGQPAHGMGGIIPDYGTFTHALIDGFNPVPSLEHMWSDTNGNRELTFDELANWLPQYFSWHNLDGTLAYEMDFGDPVVFRSDMWSPVSFKSDDFTGNLRSSEVIPAPGALLLCPLGLIMLPILRKRYLRN